MAFTSPLPLELESPSALTFRIPHSRDTRLDFLHLLPQTNAYLHICIFDTRPDQTRHHTHQSEALLLLLQSSEPGENVGTAPQTTRNTAAAQQQHSAILAFAWLNNDRRRKKEKERDGESRDCSIGKPVCLAAVGSGWRLDYSIVLYSIDYMIYTV